MGKKKKDAPKAWEWSRDEYLTNPVASVSEATGVSPAMPDDPGEGTAQRSLAARPAAAKGKNKRKGP